MRRKERFLDFGICFCVVLHFEVVENRAGKEFHEVTEPMLCYKARLHLSHS